MQPQMNAPSHASGGRIHVCLRTYVPLHYGGHKTDKRRCIRQLVNMFGKLRRRQVLRCRLAQESVIRKFRTTADDGKSLLVQTVACGIVAPEL